MSRINFKNEEEVKEYLTNIGTEYRFTCFKEKNSEGCHLLGDYLEAVKKDFAAAAKVYQANCDERNYAKSCVKYGSYCYLGRGTEEDIAASGEYYKKACDLNSSDGCLFAGCMLTQEVKVKEKNYPEGLRYLEKSCSLGNPKGCYFASGLCISGLGELPIDKAKASRLSQLACDGGNIFACMNLSQMYKTGDGVEKDEKKSMEFRERAKEIREDSKRKRTIGLQQYVE